ncbi:hypothetical protein JYU34_009185 [Plutella xylostella]|uniref:Peptidase C1A papain C-terminal domain-containing protein n=1 Tax=Plutella xylostella TaxID=51655 RepID=A0ABQ7QND0_PLUXY|nr:hypothetical protein JYU34_009185 [Plutella xylostella]
MSARAMCLLALVAGALCSPAPLAPTAAPARAPRSSDNQRWLDFVADYARAQTSQSGGGGGGVPQPFRLDLPIEGRGSLPVLVLPVPVAVPGSCGSEQPPRPALPAADPTRVSSVFRVSAANYARAPQPAPAPALAPAPAPQPSAFEYFGVQNKFGQTEAPVNDFVPVAASSDYLVQQFRLQQPSAPQLPPVLLPAGAPAPVLQGPLGPLTPGRAPAPLRWPRALRLRAALTVPRADYTETYATWWDEASGASRTQFHGGTTTTLSQRTGDGLYKYSEIRMDNSESRPLRRCATSRPQRAAPAPPPGLPDPAPFTFVGYSTLDGAAVEVWRHAVDERGAGEQRAFHHELVLTRGAAGDAMPVRYSVRVDSSVLGAASDGWEHRYTDVRAGAVPAADLAADLDAACDVTETLEAADPEAAARLRPLQEFTRAGADPRHDQALLKYAQTYNRVYADAKEQAVRKNLFTQCSRFVVAGNRQGASFEMGVNFLSDRLDAELSALLGVAFNQPGDSAEQDPHDAAALPGLARRLPAAFDWRDVGAVSHVRYQGSCKSCWAVAVTGAVEGALFVARAGGAAAARAGRGGRLTALAEQALVDCAQQTGAHGCGGTWPSHAYDYVKLRGLPALDTYGPHKEKVEACRERQAPPETHIGAYVNVTRNSWPALKVAIGEHAPTVVIIDSEVKSFIFYKKGVLYDDRCGKQQPRLNHAVLAVGWGPAGGAAGTGGAQYVTIKNSWSERWGEGGYARLHAPANTCGVLALPSYPRLAPADVDQP